jgi:hypothetical protein
LQQSSSNSDNSNSDSDSSSSLSYFTLQQLERAMARALACLRAVVPYLTACDAVASLQEKIVSNSNSSCYLLLLPLLQQSSSTLSVRLKEVVDVVLSAVSSTVTLQPRDHAGAT